MEKLHDGVMEKQNTPREQHLMNIITAMGWDTSDIYCVDTSSGEIVPYRMSGKAVAVEEGLKAGLTCDSLMKLYIAHNVHPEDQEIMLRNSALDFVKYELSNKESFHVHYRILRDGVVHYFILKCIRVGEGPEVNHILYIFASEDKAYFRRKMAEDTAIDDLTGVLTRQAFIFSARKLIDENPDKEFDLTVADVENFKLVNAVYGEAKGDEVLKFLGEYYQYHTCEGGIVGRIGPDRFAGLAISQESRKKEWMEEMIEGVNHRSPVNINVKYGIYSSVDHKLPVTVMCDRALLAVKSIKRNFAMSYATYDGPVSNSHMRAQMYEAHFERAIKEEEFVVWYQPKYDAVTEKIIGAEALVRWRLPNGSFVSPGEFIPTFEEDGLIVRLDEYVLTNVCKKIKAWIDKGIKVVPISVNLSRSSLHYEGTIERYKKIINEIGVPIDKVPLEITESATIRDARIKALMHELKAAGFVLHMDDFGSGLSSLSSINMLPIDVVKLDKSLIDYIGDKGGDELLKHTVELAHFKELIVIAEGVEVKSQLDFLKKIGVDEIQGYYYAKPMPYEELVKFFEKNNVGR